MEIIQKTVRKKSKLKFKICLTKQMKFNRSVRDREQIVFQTIKRQRDAENGDKKSLTTPHKLKKE